jgi:hypothetical protein
MKNYIITIIAILGQILFLMSTFIGLTGMWAMLFDWEIAAHLMLGGLAGMFLFSLPMNMKV